MKSESYQEINLYLGLMKQVLKNSIVAIVVINVTVSSTVKDRWYPEKRIYHCGAERF